MKSSRLIVSLSILLLGLIAFSSRGDDAWTRKKKGVEIPVRDGKALIADVYLPPQHGRYPTILIQTPYNRLRLAAALPDDTTKESLFDRDHYAVVVLDWRGFYASKEARQGQERAAIGKDGFDAVEWISQQSWSDGKIGTWGPSALGRVQFATALEQPPHLVCCVPLVAPVGYSYADYYENGVLREADVQMLDRLGYGLGAIVRPASRSSAPLYKATALAERPERFNVPMLMITGWYDHGLTRHIESFETLRARAGPATRDNIKLVIGPWHHMAIGKAKQGALEYPGAAGERERISQRFFDTWLRGQKETETDRNESSVVRWWQMGEEQWFSAASLGAVNTSRVTLYLHEDGTLSERADTEGFQPTTRKFVSDPAKPVPTIGGANLETRGWAGVPSQADNATPLRAADDAVANLLAGPHDQGELERRDDVLVYTAAAQTEPLRIFGRVTVALTFAVDQKDANFAVRVCDVYPDGRSMLICDSMARALYRAGTDEPKPIEPGETYTLELRLPPTAQTLGAGHRLRVSIAGSNYPRFELNSHTGEDHYNPRTAVAAHCTVFHGGKKPSTLTIPLLEGP
jgi:predicted acyl esterase